MQRDTDQVGGMDKLFNLKEWLTVTDAARHLAIVFGEDVTDADVLRLALDGRLRLSVYFVNHSNARCGKVVRYTDAQLISAIESGELPDDLSWKKWPKDLAAAMRGDFGGELTTYLDSDRIDDGRYVTFGDVTTLTGVWDLTMIGPEKLDIEHQYQMLTGGPSVTLQTLGGVLVEGHDGLICELQASYDDNKFQSGSKAQLVRLNQHIAENNIGSAKSELLLAQYAENRTKFKDKKKSRPESENYHPAGGLPKDAVLVVRTAALREFERQANDARVPTSRAHVSDKLARMNQAAAKFWENANREDSGTQPVNATVAAWLVKQGFSETLADKAATIIRPEWAAVGRKPEQ